MKAPQTNTRTCHALGVCQAGDSTCQGACRLHADAPPAGGYPFAPGVLQRCTRRVRRISPLGRLVLQTSAVLAFASALGFLAGLAQAQGWPL